MVKHRGEDGCQCDACKEGLSDDEVFARLAEFVGRVGVAVTGQPNNWHSVGMWQYDLPEIALSIQDGHAAMLFINEVFLVWRENGCELGDAKVFREVRDRPYFNGFFCEIELNGVLDPRMPQFVLLHGFYRSHPEFKGEEPLRLVHFLVPDKNNCLPFFPSYDKALDQPMLGYPKDLNLLLSYINDRQLPEGATLN